MCRTRKLQTSRRIFTCKEIQDSPSKNAGTLANMKGLQLTGDHIHEVQKCSLTTKILFLKYTIFRLRSVTNLKKITVRSKLSLQMYEN